MKNKEEKFHSQIDKKARRKLKAMNEVKKSELMELAKIGIIGWPIAVSTLVGTLIGLWLDARFQSSRSWTLSLMIAGLLLGCLNAWFLLDRESKDINKKNKNK